MKKMATVQNVTIDGFAKDQISVVNKFGAVFAKVAERFAVWKEARKTRMELDRLTNAQLRDIGIYRSDIPAVARGVFNGRRG